MELREVQGKHPEGVMPALNLEEGVGIRQEGLGIFQCLQCTGASHMVSHEIF